MNPVSQKRDSFNEMITAAAPKVKQLHVRPSREEAPEDVVLSLGRQLLARWGQICMEQWQNPVSVPVQKDYPWAPVPARELFLANPYPGEPLPCGIFIGHMGKGSRDRISHTKNDFPWVRVIKIETARIMWVLGRPKGHRGIDRIGNIVCKNYKYFSLRNFWNQPLYYVYFNTNGLLIYVQNNTIVEIIICSITFEIKMFKLNCIIYKSQ
jgi:hypothetical protein